MQKYAFVPVVLKLYAFTNKKTNMNETLPFCKQFTRNYKKHESSELGIRL